MDAIIRDAESSDLTSVYALNEAEVPHLGSTSLEQLRWFALHAAYFRIAFAEDRLAAFLIGLRPGSDYASPNYRWFCDHYTDFAYVDRVAVADFARREGLASRLYDDFAASVPTSIEHMTCEVNIEPPNPESMQYHLRLGFRQVGSQKTENGTKVVALLEKELRPAA